MTDLCLGRVPIQSGAPSSFPVNPANQHLNSGSHLQLGKPSSDEEHLPVQVQDQGTLQFDFFGSGQQILAPVGAHDQQLIQIQDNNDLFQGNQEQQQQDDWSAWPEKLPAIGQLGTQLLNLNINNAPLVVMQDLNEMPIVEDPQEVLVHPFQGHEPEEVLHLPPQSDAEPQQEALMEEVADNLPVNVEVHLPEMQNSLHHEIQEDALIEDAELLEMADQQGITQGQQDNEQFVFDNIQLGMVRTFFTNPLVNLPRPVDLSWLAPRSDEFTEKKNKTLIEIPTKWLGFFQALLIAPTHHCWAKQLLETSFPSLLKGDNDWASIINTNGNPSSSTSIINTDCSPSSSKACTILETELTGFKNIEEAILEQSGENSSPGKKRTRKSKLDTPLVDSIVRRSSRVQANCNGFKMSSCKVKNCLGCNADPPTLSPASLTKIGTSLCQLKPEEVEEHNLLKKKMMEPVGKKPRKLKKTKEGKFKESDDDEE